jgi:hypothetical protein
LGGRKWTQIRSKDGDHKFQENSLLKENKIKFHEMKKDARRKINLKNLSFSG